MARNPASPACLLAALAILNLSAPAAYAKDDDCALFRALADADDAQVEGIGLNVSRSGLIDVAYRGGDTPLKQATSCDIQGPAEAFDFSCSWEEAGLAAAEQRLTRLRQRIEPCLPVPVAFTPGTPQPAIESYKTLRQWEATIEPESGDLEASRYFYLSLIEHGTGTKTYSVELWVWR